MNLATTSLRARATHDDGSGANEIAQVVDISESGGQALAFCRGTLLPAPAAA